MTLDIADTNMTSEVMDHHGLIAGLCKELKIAERINDRIGSLDPRRIVQPGLAVVAMIINGLGFTNRRLYLTPQFFESKAVGQLLEEGIKAADLNDHALGKALEEISDYGCFGLTVFTKTLTDQVLLVPQKGILQQDLPSLLEELPMYFFHISIRNLSVLLYYE